MMWKSQLDEALEDDGQVIVAPARFKHLRVVCVVLVALDIAPTPLLTSMTPLVVTVSCSPYYLREHAYAFHPRDESEA